MAKFAIPASLREDQGKGASRRLRHRGMLPAVVYGGDRKPASIEIEHRVAAKAAEDEAFYTSIIDLVVDDKRRQRVVLRDMQRHPFKAQIMHMDFMRISDDEKLTMHVPLHFTNESSSPAGKKSGVVISHLISDVEILCLPKDLPEFIEVDLSDMDVGNIIHLSEIKLPEGVEIPSLQIEDADDSAVVMAQHVTVVSETEETEDGDDEAAGAEDEAPAEDQDD
ncbi:MAG: 50S ribosomal protein L25 [Lysobacteraceae bacterium]|nr:MAG: 50S ribosomal protein L25 [Xanthomonadaceae bacterium]